jgi:hypothetical protein
MNSVRLNQTWLATGAGIAAISLVLAFQRGSAQVGRADALHSTQAAAKAVVGKQAGSGSGSFVMDGDWFYVLHGNHFYKIQKSTMSVFQTLELN